MSDKFKFNTNEYLVLTDSGFRPFVGIAEMSKSSETTLFNFSDGSHIEVTAGHKFITNITPINGEMVGIPVHAKSLSVGDHVSTMDGDVEIVNISPGKSQSTFDLIEVGDNKYKTNNIISHNCEFLSSDPLLIDSIILNILEDATEEPIHEDMGFKFYQKLKGNTTYILGMDPATGTGEDFTTMLVYDFHDMSLVCEYRSNTVSSPNAYATLKWLLTKIEQMQSITYFSIENNGVGEGIIALYENDETLPMTAEFLSEEGAKRLGMRTESKVKLRTCLTLKQMVESGTIGCKSSTMVKELKSFISTRGSYSAQIGATDDLISSCLIVIRVLQEMATYEQRAFDIINKYETLTSEDSSGFTEDWDDSYVPDGMVI